MTELSYRLAGEDGYFLGPPSCDWSEAVGMLKKVYPTLHAERAVCNHSVGGITPNATAFQNWRPSFTLH